MERKGLVSNIYNLCHANIVAAQSVPKHMKGER